MVGCAQAVARNKHFLVQFDDSQKIEISSSMLVSLSLKEEVYMDEAISHSTKK